MTHIEEISKYITQYGYLAILLGTFLEGETIVIIAGYLASQGLIAWELVAVCAVLGSCTSDQIMFSIGKFKGPWVMQRFAWLDRGAKKVLPLMRKHENLLAFGFRFVYGVRNVTPICLGAGGMSYMRFFILNVTGGIVWALSFVGAGYFFGEAVKKLLDDDKHYGMIGALILVGIILLGWLGKRLLGKYRKRKKCEARAAEVAAMKKAFADSASTGSVVTDLATTSETAPTCQNNHTGAGGNPSCGTATSNNLTGKDEDESGGQGR